MTYCSVGGGLPKARGLVTTITVFILKQVTARGRGRKNLGRGRSSLVIVNEGSGSFSGKPYFQGEP
jgi:hypothetical protein